MADSGYDFTGLHAVFFNCTLKKSPSVSNTDGLIHVVKQIMDKQGVTGDVIRPVDYERYDSLRLLVEQ